MITLLIIYIIIGVIISSAAIDALSEFIEKYS